FSKLLAQSSACWDYPFLRAGAAPGSSKMPSQTLEALIEEASRHLSAQRLRHPQISRPMDGLQLLRQDSPSAFEASWYAPVLCLILQGRDQVSIGDRTLSFGTGECLLVSHDLPVCSRVTTAPYLALVLKVDGAAIRKLYDEVAE